MSYHVHVHVHFGVDGTRGGGVCSRNIQLYLHLLISGVTGLAGAGGGGGVIVSFLVFSNWQWKSSRL